MPENGSLTPVIAENAQTRRENILKQLKEVVEKCKENYCDRKELANDKDENVVEICDLLFEALSYGLRQQGNFAVTAASLFQNMQEIVIGSLGSINNANDASFWDFCQNHLTCHERERFENLKNVRTKTGRGRAFIHAALNENSLQRYLLTWLSDKDLLSRYYTHWSFFLNDESAGRLSDIVDCLGKILFALTIDATELDKTVRTVQSLRDEPIIYAPAPIAAVKNKRKVNAIERPIASNESENIKPRSEQPIVQPETEVQGGVEFKALPLQKPDPLPFDSIESELEFLKNPLPDVYSEKQVVLNGSNSHSEGDVSAYFDCEDKSDTSSQCSKSSSSIHDCSVLQDKLRELNERYALLETRVAQLTLENRQLVRRLTRHFNESGIDPTSSFATNFLITIPTVKLIKPTRATGSSYYVYEVHITMKQRLEHWAVLRRYRDFSKLHKSILRTHPSAAAVEFPPKKHFGNKNLLFVEERRQQLQIYLLNLVESLPQVEACKTKADLQKVFPFLRER